MQLHGSLAKVLLLLFVFELIGFMLAYSGINQQNIPGVANITTSLVKTTNNLVGAFNYTIIAPKEASGSWLPAWLYEGFAWFVNGMADVVDIMIQIGILIMSAIEDFLLIFFYVLPTLLLSANLGMFAFIFTAGYSILLAYVSFYLALGIYELITRLVHI